MNHRHARMASSILATCLYLAAQPARAAFFVPLGVPTPTGIGIPVSAAHDVTDDGTVVLGRDGFALGQGYGIGVAYRWTRDSGKVLFDHSSISGEWYWNRAAPGAAIVQRWLDAEMIRGLPALA